VRLKLWRGSNQTNFIYSVISRTLTIVNIKIDHQNHLN
ncbi:MAG: hypothetical protein ACJAS1_003536, partial [Oleiphilaceae bacterium]